jgi:DNA-binding Xre family transcriptional regulator
MDRKWIEDRLGQVYKSPSTLARALGINRSQVTRLLQGKRQLRIDEVEAVARHLDCHPVEVLKACGLDLLTWRG